MLEGVRDTHLIFSAIGAAGNYPGDLFDKAAVLFRSLVKNHPFLDGNKRTAVLSVSMFLHRNGYDSAAPAQRWTNLATLVAGTPRSFPLARLRRSIQKCVRRIPGQQRLIPTSLLHFMRREPLLWTRAIPRFGSPPEQ